jgi:putative acetyltransferase
MLSARVMIRRQHPDERPSVRDVVTRAFRDPTVADLVESLQGARAGRDGLSYVAVLDGQVVGHVLVSWSFLDAPQRLVDVLVLSPLAVTPEHQAHGIGGQLVQHAVAEAARTGAPLLFLEGSPVYYQRFGFERASSRGFTPPSVRIPDAAFQVVLLPSYQPWMSGALVYAEQFWIYDRVGLRQAE